MKIEELDRADYVSKIRIVSINRIYFAINYTHKIVYKLYMNNGKYSFVSLDGSAETASGTFDSQQKVFSNLGTNTICYQASNQEYFINFLAYILSYKLWKKSGDTNIGKIVLKELYNEI